MAGALLQGDSVTVVVGVILWPPVALAEHGPPTSLEDATHVGGWEC